MRVLAEVLFAWIGGGELRFQVSRFAVDGRGEPVAPSATTPTSVRVGPDALRVHSTSWRYGRGKIVLMYLVYSDRLRFRGRVRRALTGALPPAQNAASADRSAGRPRSSM